MRRADWTFREYLMELIDVSEILEVPGMKARRDELVAEMLERYPEECEGVGIER